MNRKLLIGVGIVVVILMALASFTAQAGMVITSDAYGNSNMYGVYGGGNGAPTIVIESGSNTNPNPVPNPYGGGYNWNPNNNNNYTW